MGDPQDQRGLDAAVGGEILMKVVMHGECPRELMGSELRKLEQRCREKKT